jgi:hypothetical protein
MHIRLPASLGEQHGTLPRIGRVVKRRRPALVTGGSAFAEKGGLILARTTRDEKKDVTQLRLNM